MKEIIFTLCSNNYLAQAKTLADSVKEFNAEVHFVIGLVDKIHPEIDYSFFEPFEIVPFDTIGYDFSEMINEYNIVEFNTAVKPFYIEFFFKKYTGQNLKLCYLDPDIEIFDSFGNVFQLLESHNFLVTPHIIAPGMTISSYEPRFLNVGIFNLGFFALRHNQETMRFILWWKERLKTLCKIDLAKGLFVDQLWVNYLPVLFEGSCIIKNPGLNVAYWNFHERSVSFKNNRFYVNDTFPLIFFHFSSYNPLNPDAISRYYKLSFIDRQDILPIYSSYREKLLKNRYEMFSSINRLMQFKKNHPIADKKPVNKKSIRMRIIISLKSRLNKFFKRYFDV
jgi:hypothetical protein